MVPSPSGPEKDRQSPRDRLGSFLVGNLCSVNVMETRMNKEEHLTCRQNLSVLVL